jgi:hypothetical protein
MKKNIYYIFIAFLFFTCKKENLPNAPTFQAGKKEFGFFKGIKNGKNFEASAFCTLYPENIDVCHISFLTDEGEEVYREVFTCGNVPLKRGKYTDFNENDVTKLYASGSIQEEDGCIVGQYYKLDFKANNYIELTSVDTIQGMIKGYTDLTFNAEPPIIEPYAAKLHFKKLHFEVRIKK